MADDAAWYRAERADPERDDGQVLEESFLEGYAALDEGSVDLLVTSPPYLNNYHYNRNTRPHLYWLDFCAAPRDLKHLESLNFGTYWQNAAMRSGSNSTSPSTIPRSGGARGGEAAESGQGNLRRQGLGQLRRALLQRLRPLPRRRSAVPQAGGDGAGGDRQLHPARVPIPTDRFLASIAATRGFRVADIHVPREARVGSSIVESSVRAGKANGGTLYESIVELRHL